MKVIVDDNSGFCFGVKLAIDKAEEMLRHQKTLYCLGDIVHNDQEVERLKKLGLKIIEREEYFQLSNCKVLIRAHGEPPETYEYAKQNNIELIDGTCPVVSKLQQRVRKAYDKSEDNGQLVIYGKKTHPEVKGLTGQVHNRAIVVENTNDLEKVDLSKPITLFSQTTMNRDNYITLQKTIRERIESQNLDENNLQISNSICGQVANRGPGLEAFSNEVDAVIFVGGAKSSNSKVLYSQCKNVNPNSFFVTSADEVKKLPLHDYKLVGVCGATSTPQWLMEQVAEVAQKTFS